MSSGIYKFFVSVFGLDPPQPPFKRGEKKGEKKGGEEKAPLIKQNLEDILYLGHSFYI